MIVLQLFAGCTFSDKCLCLLCEMLLGCSLVKDETVLLLFLYRVCFREAVQQITSIVSGLCNVPVSRTDFLSLDSEVEPVTCLEPLNTLEAWQVTPDYSLL